MSKQVQSSSSDIKPPPIEFPSLLEIKKSLPKECFESSVSTSMYYVVRSFLLTIINMVSLTLIRPRLSAYPIADAVVCTMYMLMQGLLFWGFFTIGHDCGHSSFSRHSRLNFIVGCIMHSLILTPYESWRLSHRYHHKNTGNIDRDEIFYPQRKSIKAKHARSSLYTFGTAWFLYLLFGYPPRKVNHFNPSEPLFIKSDKNQINASVVISILAWLTVAGCSAALTRATSLSTMALYYYGPIFVFASFLVVVTFLHHNDEKTPWYGDSEWTYVKGNLSSVDRDYGALINNLSHNIGTHQVHHLFPIIPHYKLVPASKAFASAYPQFVREEKKEGILRAFFKTVALYVHFGEASEEATYFTLQHASKQE